MTSTPPDRAPPAPASAGTPAPDLPLAPSILTPPLIAAVFAACVLIAPATAPWWVGQEQGVFETPGILVLVPGIVCGFLLFWRNPPLPAAWIRWWVLGWTLACVYFLGEEYSWGQHALGWETPAPFEHLNKQGEANLHNTSSWLNQKPRMVVELWMLVGGIVIPLVHRFARPTGPARRDYWFWPTLPCIGAAATHFALRAVDLVAPPDSPPDGPPLPLVAIGSGESREFFIALFLSMFLVSVWLRARGACPPAGHARAVP